VGELSWGHQTADRPFCPPCPAAAFDAQARSQRIRVESARRHTVVTPDSAWWMEVSGERTIGCDLPLNSCGCSRECDSAESARPWIFPSAAMRSLTREATLRDRVSGAGDRTPNGHGGSMRPRCDEPPTGAAPEERRASIPVSFSTLPWPPLCNHGPSRAIRSVGWTSVEAGGRAAEKSLLSRRGGARKQPIGVRELQSSRDAWAWRFETGANSRAAVSRVRAEGDAR
jgi:hypothetical protein